MTCQSFSTSTLTMWTIPFLRTLTKSPSLIPSLNPSKEELVMWCNMWNVYFSSKTDNQFNRFNRFQHLHFQARLHPTHLQSFSEECSPSVLMPECVSGKICDIQSEQILYKVWTNQKMPVSYLHAVSEQLWLTFIWLRMAAEQYCLKWTNYQRNVTSSFKTLLENEEFVDVSILRAFKTPSWIFTHQVTISAEGKSCSAHRVVLSAASPYFRNLLSSLKVL